ncbi:hypothetical protein [Streptomyces fradiae]|uniref:hypothetical protein n=1 Tax=Streptomyces fradiae TaxID=1906 RepID=UPI0035BE39D1
MRLAHVRPTDPGHTRVRHGRGFRCPDPLGRPLRDPAEPARTKALVIPPAWRDVWIRARPNGHLQAVGTDAAGRRQYLYHPVFRARQEQAEHEHVLEVAEALPRLREAVEAGQGHAGPDPRTVPRHRRTPPRPRLPAHRRRAVGRPEPDVRADHPAARPLHPHPRRGRPRLPGEERQAARPRRSRRADTARPHRARAPRGRRRAAPRVLVGPRLARRQRRRGQRVRARPRP